jgi:ribulose-bisphosphate carboxylase large chain
MFTRHPALGLAFQAYQTFWRLAGIDQLHCNALQNKFWEPDASVVHSVQTCLKPMFGDDSLMPVLSSGQWGGQAPETYRLVNSVDVMYLAGGGIMAHPGGPPAGLTAIRQAWEAAVAGISLDEQAAKHPELRQAVAKFGGKS